MITLTTEQATERLTALAREYFGQQTEVKNVHLWNPWATGRWEAWSAELCNTVPPEAAGLVHFYPNHTDL